MAIIRTVHGNVFESKLKHIVFGMSLEGSVSIGFAESVSRQWRNLRYMTSWWQGQVRSFEGSKFTFHALCCYSLRADVGFAHTPAAIASGLGRLELPPRAVTGFVMVGNDYVGRKLKADVTAILQAINNSPRRVVLYYHQEL